MTKRYHSGIGAALDVVGGRWKPLIVWALRRGGPRRFGELKRAVVGISQKMLAKELRELDADGLVSRRAYAEVPPRVEYAATEACLALLPALGQLDEWGRGYALGVGALVMGQAGERGQTGGS